jgi:hypothetical protein
MKGKKKEQQQWKGHNPSLMEIMISRIHFWQLTGFSHR